MTAGSLDSEVPENTRSAPRVSDVFGDETDPLHQAMVLAKLASYYTLSGQKDLPDFGESAELQILQKSSPTDDLNRLRQAAKGVKLHLLTKQDGIHDVLKWCSFTARYNTPYLLHSAANAKVRSSEETSAY